jgi:hypothetical protein
MLTRRQLLISATLTSTALLAAGAGVVAHWWDQPAAAGYTHLSGPEAGFIRAFSEAAWPATAAIPVGGADLSIDHFLDALLTGLEPALRTLVRTGLHAIDAATLPTEGHPFSALPVADRAALLASWLAHDNPELRSAAMGLVTLTGMGYSAHPAVSPYFAVMHGCGFGE